MLSLGAIASCGRADAHIIIQGSPNDFDPSDFDWNLPTAVSAGVEPERLAYFTNDELMLLHQPYVDIADAIAAEFGVGLSIGTINCYFMTRYMIIDAITNISLAEHDSRLRELGYELRLGVYANKIMKIMVESGYLIMDLINAMEDGLINPIEAYYRIQQVGVVSFYEEVYYILTQTE